jgi:hypothetical protein
MLGEPHLLKHLSQKEQQSYCVALNFFGAG